MKDIAIIYMKKGEIQMDTKTVPVEKNKEYEIDITSYGHEGEGVGKLQDFTVFVPGAIKGERVKLLMVKVNKSYGFGKLIEVITPSEERREPSCPTYKQCGGCKLQHMSYEEQLQFKTGRVKAALERIGKLTEVTIHPTIGMEEPYNYRNKVQLPIGKVGDRVEMGFYAPRSHRIIPMESCGIQNETADRVMKLVKGWANKYRVEAYDEESNTGLLRHLMVRWAYKTGETMVVLVVNGEELPRGEELIKALRDEVPGLVSIIINVNKKSTNVVLGDKNIVLWGKDTITDYIGEYRFKISPHSFFQVNPTQTVVLYEKALQYAKLSGEEVVFDAYCGTGTISLFLSAKAKKVYGVEIVPQAIENAIENAKENQVENVEFMVGKAEEEIPRLIGIGIKAQVVVVDPPRKGCEASLLKAIAKMAPEQIVYVSCDVETLARDLRILEDMGYKTKEVQPVDMFPQTGHVEVVVKLTKNEVMK